MTETTEVKTSTLTLNDLNAAVYAYGQAHCQNFPGVSFDAATMDLFRQAPTVCTAYSQREIEPGTEYALAEESLVAIAKMYQLRFQKDFQTSFKMACDHHPTLKAAYAGMDANMALGGRRQHALTRTEAERLLMEKAKEIQSHEPALTLPEAFRKACGQMPTAYQAYADVYNT